MRPSTFGKVTTARACSRVSTLLSTCNKSPIRLTTMIAAPYGSKASAFIWSSDSNRSERTSLPLALSADALLPFRHLPFVFYLLPVYNPESAALAGDRGAVCNRLLACCPTSVQRLSHAAAPAVLSRK